MTRSTTIIFLFAAVAALIAITTAGIASNRTSFAAQMSEERRTTRENFFGTAKEPAPIPKGQEMRPKW